MPHEFEIIEDAVLAALEPLYAEGVKTMDVYVGQLEVDELSEITYQFPFIYVIAAGLTSETVNRTEDVNVGILIVVGDRNLRGGKAAARGDASSPGVYELLAMTEDKLHRKKILAGWTPALRRKEEALKYDSKENVCIYAARYEISSVQ